VRSDQEIIEHLKSEQFNYWTALTLVRCIIDDDKRKSFSYLFRDDVAQKASSDEYLRALRDMMKVSVDPEISKDIIFAIDWILNEV
jgi:hypothetical protein